MSNPIRRLQGSKTALSVINAVSSPAVGDAWIASNTNVVYVWDGLVWKNKGPMINHVTLSFSGSLPQTASVTAVK